MFQEKQSRPNFLKTNISYPLIRTGTCAYQGERKGFFSENLACFVFWNIILEICSFALLPTNLLKALQRFWGSKITPKWWNLYDIACFHTEVWLILTTHADSIHIYFWIFYHGSNQSLLKTESTLEKNYKANYLVW